MINQKRLEHAKTENEVSQFSQRAEEERKRIRPFFTDFMESAYWNIPKHTDESTDEPGRFTRSDMFRAFMYGAREAGHLYREVKEGMTDAQ